MRFPLFVGLSVLLAWFGRYGVRLGGLLENVIVFAYAVAVLEICLTSQKWPVGSGFRQSAGSQDVEQKPGLCAVCYPKKKYGEKGKPTPTSTHEG
jgi:hypothetical protein